MLPDDVFRTRLRATIESLRYWIPSIADTAETEEGETETAWKMAISPKVTGASPFELMLRADQMHDIASAGEVYENRPIQSFDIFIELAEAIVAGNAVQRRWVSAATGAPCSVETLVLLGNGRLWRDGRNAGVIPDGVPRDALVRHDRNFLPYRR